MDSGGYSGVRRRAAETFIVCLFARKPTAATPGLLIKQKGPTSINVIHVNITSAPSSPKRGKIRKNTKNRLEILAPAFC